ncbi:hypothetical protein PAPYR_3887 [Paratrimastix pyriformis]|uniref:Leucine-rich repeat and WD repeat-containing protein 1 n=1 Tax=Paratrimastix pyriformis TaxID=342808 RepID=A0ABQ8UNY5_9EUKA|nr:hypothetical protein PAPYR_3887 [Paratrimastix pyriformis]
MMIDLAFGTYDGSLVHMKLDPQLLAAQQAAGHGVPDPMVEMNTVPAVSQKGINAVTVQGRFISTGGTDEWIRLLDVQTETKIVTIGQGKTTAMSSDSKGEFVFAVGASTDHTGSRGGFWAWRTSDGSLVLEKDLRHFVPGNVAVHPSDRMAMLVGDNGRCFLWNLLTGKRAFGFRCPALPHHTVGLGVATAGDLTLSKLSNKLVLAAWSPRGTRYAVASQVAVWGGSLAGATTVTPAPAPKGTKPAKGTRGKKQAAAKRPKDSEADEVDEEADPDQSVPLALLLRPAWKISALAFITEDVLLVGGEGGQWSLCWVPEVITQGSPAVVAVQPLAPLSGRIKGLFTFRLPAGAPLGEDGRPPSTSSTPVPDKAASARKKARSDGPPTSCRAMVVAACSDGSLTVWELVPTGGKGPLVLVGECVQPRRMRARLTCAAMARGEPASSPLWQADVTLVPPSPVVSPLLALPDQVLARILFPGCPASSLGDDEPDSNEVPFESATHPALLYNMLSVCRRFLTLASQVRGLVLLPGRSTLVPPEQCAAAMEALLARCGASLESLDARGLPSCPVPSRPLPRLHDLRMDGGEMLLQKPAALTALAAQCPQLRRLWLSVPAGATVELGALGALGSSLEEFTLIRAPAPGPLAEASSAGSAVARGWAALEAGLPKLTSLALEGLDAPFSDIPLGLLGRLTSLSVRDAAPLAYLAKCPSLRLRSLAADVPSDLGLGAGGPLAQVLQLCGTTLQSFSLSVACVAEAQWWGRLLGLAATSAPGLTTLRLRGPATPPVAGAAVALELPASLPPLLRTLELAGAALTDDQAVQLASRTPSQLRSLGLSRNELRSATQVLGAFCRRCPGLDRVDLSENAALRDFLRFALSGFAPRHTAKGPAGPAPASPSRLLLRHTALTDQALLELCEQFGARWHLLDLSGSAALTATTVLTLIRGAPALQGLGLAGLPWLQAGDAMRLVQLRELRWLDVATLSLAAGSGDSASAPSLLVQLLPQLRQLGWLRVAAIPAGAHKSLARTMAALVVMGPEVPDPEQPKPLAPAAAPADEEDGADEDEEGADENEEDADERSRSEQGEQEAPTRGRPSTASAEPRPSHSKSARDRPRSRKQQKPETPQ